MPTKRTNKKNQCNHQGAIHSTTRATARHASSLLNTKHTHTPEHTTEKLIIFFYFRKRKYKIFFCSFKTTTNADHTNVTIDFETTRVCPHNTPCPSFISLFSFPVKINNLCYTISSLFFLKLKFSQQMRMRAHLFAHLFF